MIFLIAADCILLLHLTFSLFTVLGGLLVLRRSSLLWIHLAAVLWGVTVQWADWICPLTPLENFLRTRGGEKGYGEGFIEHYLTMLLYPANLTVELRYLIGLGLVAINIIIYGYIFLTHHRQCKKNLNHPTHPM